MERHYLGAFVAAQGAVGLGLQGVAQADCSLGDCCFETLPKMFSRVEEQTGSLDGPQVGAEGAVPYPSPISCWVGSSYGPACG